MAQSNDTRQSLSVTVPKTRALRIGAGPFMVHNIRVLAGYLYSAANASAS
jgi:hypothetical protein